MGFFAMSMKSIENKIAVFKTDEEKIAYLEKILKRPNVLKKRTLKNIIFVLINLYEKKGKHKKAADTFLKWGYLDDAAATYSNFGLWELAGKIYEGKEDFSRAAKEYIKKANNSPQKQKLDWYIKAVECYHRYYLDFEKALFKVGRELEKQKLISLVISLYKYGSTHYKIRTYSQKRNRILQRIKLLEAA